MTGTLTDLRRLAASLDLALYRNETRARLQGRINVELTHRAEMEVQRAAFRHKLTVASQRHHYGRPSRAVQTWLSLPGGTMPRPALIAGPVLPSRRY